MLSRFSFHFHLFDHKQFELFSKYLFALSLPNWWSNQPPLCLLKPFNLGDGFEGAPPQIRIICQPDVATEASQQHGAWSRLHLRKINSQINRGKCTKKAEMSVLRILMGAWAGKWLQTPSLQGSYVPLLRLVTLLFNTVLQFLSPMNLPSLENLVELKGKEYS